MYKIKIKLLKLHYVLNDAISACVTLSLHIVYCLIIISLIGTNAAWTIEIKHNQQRESTESSVHSY